MPAITPRILAGLTACTLALTSLSSAPASAEPEPGTKQTRKVHLIMDSSGSMAEPTGGGTTRIDAAKKALHSVIDNTPDDTELGLRVYGSHDNPEGSPESCKDSDLVVPIATDNRDRLRTEVDKYKPAGWTPIDHSLREAGKDIGSPGEDEQYTVILVSDGEETCVPDPCPAAAELAEKGIDVSVNVIGLNVSGKAKQQLQCIADKGKGEYYDVDNAEDLEEALNQAAKRTGQGLTMSGEPVTGSPTPEDAPVLEPGTYTDTLPANEEPRWYRVPRAMAENTLWAGGFIQNAADRGYALAIRWYHPNDLDDDCSWDKSSTRGGDGFNLGGVAVPSVSSTFTTACTEPSDELLLQLSLDQDTELPVQFTIVDEPAVEDPESLPEAASSPQWQDMPEEKAEGAPLIGGASLADAPVLEPGSAHPINLTRGEVQFFAVDLDWGQSLQAQASMEAGENIYMHWSIDIYSQFGSPSGDLGTESFGNLNDGVTLKNATPEVRYNNRGEVGARGQTALPGRYYVVVAGGDADENTSLNLETPGTLQVDVIGDAGTGEPTYREAEEPQPGPDAPRPEGEDAPRPEGEQGSDEGSGQNWGLIGGLAGGAVLLAGLGVGAVWFLRRL